MQYESTVFCPMLRVCATMPYNKPSVQPTRQNECLAAELATSSRLLRQIPSTHTRCGRGRGDGADLRAALIPLRFASGVCER